jgi:hypothetical protein
MRVGRARAFAARRQQQEGGEEGRAQDEGKKAAPPLRRQLLLEDVEHDSARQKGEKHAEPGPMDLDREPHGPAGDDRRRQHPSPDPPVGVLMILAQPVVVDQEVQGHREGKKQQAAPTLLLPMEQQIADQGVVEGERPDVQVEDASPRRRLALVRPRLLPALAL